MLGVKRDPTISALRQDVARETSNIEIEKDARRPQISVSGDTGDDNDEIGLQITASQLLFDWGVSKGNIAAATANRARVVAQLKIETEDLILDIAELYFDLEAIRLKIRRTVDYIAFSRRIAKFSADRVQAGLASSAEVARARLEISRAEEEMFQLQSDRENALAELEFVIGQSIGTTPPPIRLGFMERFSSSKNVIEAVTSSPDYILSSANLEIARSAVGIAKAERKPTIRLEARGRQDLTGGRGRSGSIGITAGVNLTSSGFRGRAVIAAEQGVQAAESRLRAVERDLQNDARYFRQNLRALAASQKSLNAQVKEARTVLDSYEEQFLVGQRELVDLLTTGRDLYEAEIEEIDVTDKYLRTEYQAAHSVGMLGAMLIGSSKKAKRSN